MKTPLPAPAAFPRPVLHHHPPPPRLGLDTGRERRAHAGFTMAELMMALAIGSVVCATTMTGVLFLQKSYAATEQYATSMSDQMRVLDYLALDMRRASTVKIDTDTIILTLPGYYAYDKSDAGHRNPLPVWPTVDPTATRATYNASDSGSTVPKVTYRYDKTASLLQRQETFSDGTTTAWQTVASQVNAFPKISTDPIDPRKYTVAMSFRPAFETYDTPESNLITLATTVYLRNP